MKTLAICALAVSLGSPALLHAQTLELPQPGIQGGATIGDSYTFTWNRVPDATYYRVYVRDSTGTNHDLWFTADRSGCGPSVSAQTCAVVIQIPLATGVAEWWTQSWYPHVYSGWSQTRTFLVAGRVPIGAGSLASIESLTALGRSALAATKTPMSNGSYGAHTAVGDRALEQFDAGLTGHSGNTAVGARTLSSLTAASYSASYNTAVGYQALRSLTLGNYNIALGDLAGLNLTTGSDNIYIGHGGVANESNTMRLGQYSQNVYVGGIHGKTSGGGIGVFINADGKLGTLTSSGRFKSNVRPIGPLSDRLFSLKPVAFEYTKDLDPETLPQFGLLAEDVEKHFPELLARDADGKPYTVRYHLLVPLLLNELQKQRARAELQDERIQKLTAQHEERINQLAAQVDALLRQQQNK